MTSIRIQWPQHGIQESLFVYIKILSVLLDVENLLLIFFLHKMIKINYFTQHILYSLTANLDELETTLQFKILKNVPSLVLLEVEVCSYSHTNVKLHCVCVRKHTHTHARILRERERIFSYKFVDMRS